MESFQLNWDKHEKNISEAFLSLRKDEHFCDVTLACEDRQFQAHKVVLSAGSPFFEQILKSQKHPSPLLYLRGVEARHMESLLDFIYCGEVTLEQEELENFIKTGEELKVRGLSIMITPTVPTPLTKMKPCPDNVFVLDPSEDGSNEAVMATAPLLGTGTPLEPTYASVEQYVKSEDSEAFHEIIDWEDLKRFVTVKKGKYGSGEHKCFQCSLCGKFSKSRGSFSNIMSHIECKHFKNVFTHKCDICQESFKTKGIFNSHNKIMHKDQTITPLPITSAGAE